jgi:UDP-N-acetylglucosamine:LPS N-acetylglucosamine transferase
VEGVGVTAVLAAQIESLLADEERRQTMQAAHAALARPYAARDVALLVYNLVADSAKVITA